MFHIRSTAFVSAVTLVCFAGACRDAPTAPRIGTPPTALHSADGRSPQIRVFSGTSADAVVNRVLTAWAGAGHPEYLIRYRAQRPSTGAQGVGLSRKRVSTPTRDIVGGDGGYEDAAKELPQILDHHSDLLFGLHAAQQAIPTLLRGSMTFIGDQGAIQGNVTITGQGVVYTVNAPIANGAGTFIDCTDVLFGNCPNKKFMEGAVTAQAAPDCDAKALGTVQFTARNSEPGIGSGIALLPLTPFASQPVVVIDNIDNTSRACGTPDDGPTAPQPGGGSDPQPVYPTAPQPPYPAPAPYVPISEFHCETYQWWSGGQLDLEQTVCYNN